MIRKVINQSIDLLWGAWQAFFPFALVIGIFDALVGLATSAGLEDLADRTAESGTVDLPDALASAAISVGMFAVSLVLVSVLVVMVATAARGEPPNVAAAVVTVVGRIGTIVGSVALSTILVVVGLLLFVVPGVWLSVTLMPLLAVVVDGEAGVVESIRASYGLVRGRWLTVFGLFAILAAVSIGLGVTGTVSGAMGFLLSIVANAVSDMVMATVIWFTYRELQRQRDWPGVV